MFPFQSYYIIHEFSEKHEITSTITARAIFIRTNSRKHQLVGR
jgi:hypothetical protein